MHLESWSEYVASINHASDDEDAVPVEKPSRFCQRHPAGTDQPCGPCGRQRELQKKWTEERAEWKQWNADCRAEIKACRRCDDLGQYTDSEGLWWCEHVAPDIDACHMCDEAGWLLDAVGAVAEPAIKCNHQPNQGKP